MGDMAKPPSLQKESKSCLDMMAYACSLNYCGVCGGRMAWAWEVEAAVSCDHATALQCK
uniref:Macaca fascicularis brain cDNA clone: QccE-16941, similar to human ribosomal protein L39 (RPL39), mRNA, RefSeq: NM_001000.2 n=1 Tax=Macaca fascicularis TaxID=9541 RepID=I7GHQ3_MACFA|nr:unnamed protein product [Macaca fascicularis]